MDTSDQAIQARLEELDGLDTVSAFSVTFYRLIAGLVLRVVAPPGLRTALAGLLDVELRYHRELQALAERREVALPDVQAAGERHRIGLLAVTEYGRRLEDLEPLADAARELVMAECNYHLRRTAAVVAALEQVVRLGVSPPLVQFALGYNRYMLALESCAEPAEAEGEFVVHDPAAFRLQCLQAVSALEEGLQETELDGQLYWWMGVILEAAGLTEAAQDAYDKSTDALEDDPRGAVEAELVAKDVSPYDPTPTVITDEEVRQAGELLVGPFDPAALQGWEQDDR